jgi:hypothetical protein
MREHVSIFRIVEREPGITLVAQTAIDIDLDPGLTKRVLYPIELC